MRFDRPGPVALVAVSEEGAALATRIARYLPEARIYGSRGDLLEGIDVYEGDLRSFVGSLWPDAAAIVFVMASGIAVRSIAPYVASQDEDPAVVVVDDAGRSSIALLSGHEGRANDLAEDIAEISGALPVVTTGTESKRGVVLGVGSRRGVSKEQVLDAIDEALAVAGRARVDVRAISTIDLKKDEGGIRAAAEELGVVLRVVPRSRIRAMQDAIRAGSDFVEETTGVAAVCVPAALMGDPHAESILDMKRDGVTVAVAEDVCSSSASAPEAPSI